MYSLLRSLACALLLAPSLLPAAETQRFVLERPYQVAEIPEPDRNLPATNVILMIGDGMGIHHLSAAWAANRGRLFIENCPVTGISKTWCADKLVTDSAAAGTAMATGTKTLYKRVAVCPRGNKLDSLHFRRRRQVFHAKAGREGHFQGDAGAGLPDRPQLGGSRRTAARKNAGRHRSGESSPALQAGRRSAPGHAEGAGYPIP